MLTHFLLPPLASAQRPTTGGLFAFSASDSLSYWETPDGSIRVHYSTEGPNQTLLLDGNQDSIPDYVEQVATAAQQSLALFTELGFYHPLAEGQFNLDDDGGSAALDFYLVNFEGNSDGYFGVDECNQQKCSGYMVVENDFAGYFYNNELEALHTVIPHELFHAIQAAYTNTLPTWISEGTALWAQRRFDIESKDFRAFANAYLEQTDRPLNRPPSGPVPAFAYGTGIWWEFLTIRHGTSFVKELLEGWEPIAEEAEMVDVMVDAIRAKNDTMDSAWVTFSHYNLGSGFRAGELESYPDAPKFMGIQAIDENNPLLVTKRFYPMTTSYYLLPHTGGPLYWAMKTQSNNLLFSLHKANSRTGPVGLPIDEWASDMQAPFPIQNGETLSEGYYWLAVMNPTTAGNSVHTLLCLGELRDMETCLPEASPPPDLNANEPTELDASGCAQHPPTHIVFILMGLLLLHQRNLRPPSTIRPSFRPKP